MATSTSAKTKAPLVSLVALMPIRCDGDDYAEGDPLPAMHAKDAQPLIEGGWAELAAPDTATAA